MDATYDKKWRCLLYEWENQPGFGEKFCIVVRDTSFICRVIYEAISWLTL